jgi:catechol 2,3-dioxygenase-like lactoylglutathione lyase family enzyme
MRELHLGRLIDHVHLRARDLAATKRFYRAVLGALGKPIAADDDRHLNCDELWIDALGEDRQSTTHVHLAFQAKDPDAVRCFHEAGLAAGGRDNGKPGDRPYHPGYFAAFLLDPDGNNIEVVYHGEAKYSSDSIKIEF